MADFQKVGEYLAECGVFYFATVEGDAADVRPLGFQMVVDNKLYLGLGTHKNVYAQVKANQKVAISATKADGASWIRIKGTAVFDDDPSLVDKAFEAMPQLKPLYESNGWEMGVFHLENGTVTYYEQLMVPALTEEF